MIILLQDGQTQTVHDFEHRVTHQFNFMLSTVIATDHASGNEVCRYHGEVALGYWTELQQIIQSSSTPNRALYANLMEERIIQAQQRDSHSQTQRHSIPTKINPKD